MITLIQLNIFNSKFADRGSTYYLEDEFNQLLNVTNINTNFSLIHFNARSFLKDTDQLNVYLSCLEHRFTIIAVSET